MRTRIRWLIRRPVSGSDRRLERFRRVLKVALATPGYRMAMDSAGLGSRQAIDSVTSIPDTLARLPLLEGEDFRSAPEDYCNASAPAAPLQKLWLPFEPAPRTAILMPGFAACGPVRVAAWEGITPLERIRPEVVAAPCSVLRDIAAEVLGEPAAPPVSRAVIAFTGFSAGRLDDLERDLFWEAFQVPVFEQYMGFGGQVIARECEAREGLHVDEDCAIFEPAEAGEELALTSLTDLRRPTLRVGCGFTARLEAAVCACGSQAPRLVGLREVTRPAANAACAAR